MSDAASPGPPPSAAKPGEQPTLIERGEGKEPDATGFTVGPPEAPPEATETGQPMPLSRFGDYELLNEIGRGGMGVVYKARHVRLNRLVALKMILGGNLAHPDDRYRFEVEAAAVAQLQHSGIVALYEAGSHENQPYFSMEFVHGSSLAHRVAEGPLPGSAAARYLEATARAVHYAHTRGIIHRDLKPANILLSGEGRAAAKGDAETDSASSDPRAPFPGIPKITDFGLAKVLTTDSGQTRTGAVLGTPSYMAPEQAAGRKDIGPSCDVYSLGAILYELLTGRPPFRAETALATLTMVAEQEPIAPRLLNPAVDRDLETICLKCLEKDAKRRYATAEEFADDLGRFLRREPISARRLTAVGRALKWCRRKPALAALLFVSVLALVGFGVFGWIVAEEEHRLRYQAKIRAEGMRHLLYLAQIRQAQQALLQADPERAGRLLAHWLPRDNADAPDLRGWEWFFLRDRCGGRYCLRGHADRALAVVYSPKGDRLASAGGHPGKPGLIKIWNAATGELLYTLEGHEQAVVALAYSSDGKFLASAGYDRTVRTWDPNRGTPLQVLRGHRGHVRGVAFEPGGNRLASAGADGTIRLWEYVAESSPTWQAGRVWDARQGEINALAFSPQGGMIATAGRDKTVTLWEAGTGKKVRVLPDHQGEITCLAFSTAGNMLAAGGGPGSRRGEVRLWSVDRGILLASHFGLPDRILAVSFGREGKLAAGGSDGLIRIWDQAHSSEPLVFRGDPRVVFGLAFSPDGRRLASAGRSGRIHIWNSSGGQESLDLSALLRTEAIAFHPDSKQLASAGRSAGLTGDILLWDLDRPQKPRVLSGPSGTVQALAFAPDGRHLAAAGDDKSIRLFDLDQAESVPVLLTGHAGRVLALAFSPDGSLLASAGEDDTIRLWNISTGTVDRILTGHRNSVLAVAFSPDGRLLASGSFDKTVRVWDLGTGSATVLTGHQGSTHAVAFSPDGQQLASGSSDQTVRIWDLIESKEQMRLESAPGPVRALSYDATGRRLACVGPDSIVRLWDLVTGQEILELAGPIGPLHSVAFSPDGRRLAAAGANTVRVWNASIPTDWK
jgi:WD40 repeat protein/tRNA A-37 threonylcarbamoyl transferase component Bud32